MIPEERIERLAIPTCFSLLFIADTTLETRRNEKGLAEANPLNNLVANQGFEPRTCGL